MAAPATHIVLADKVFDRHFPDKNRAEFYTGVCFADIRRLARIPREKTHFYPESIAEMQQEEPFMAGLKFHAYIDRKTHEFREKNNLYQYFPEGEYRVEMVKLYEDRVLFGKRQDWQEIREFLYQIYNQEVIIAGNQEVVDKWHQILISYFASDMGQSEGAIAFMMSPGNPEAVIRPEVEKISQIGREEEARELVEKMYQEF